MELPAELTAGFRIEARAEIVRMRTAGYPNRTIAASLNARGVPTPSGRGQWHGATVLRHGDPMAAERWRRYMADYRARHRYW